MGEWSGVVGGVVVRVVVGKCAVGKVGRDDGWCGGHFVYIFLVFEFLVVSCFSVFRLVDSVVVLLVVSVEMVVVVLLCCLCLFGWLGCVGLWF